MYKSFQEEKRKKYEENKLKQNLESIEFKPGTIFSYMNLDFNLPLNKIRTWDLTEEIIVVFYGDHEIFLSIDWFPVGDKKRGSFNVTIATKYFGNELFYFKKTRFMKRVREYIVEAHFYAQKLNEMINIQNFDYKKYFLSKKQINEIKNSPPDTFSNPISRIEKEYNEFVKYSDFEI